MQHIPLKHFGSPNKDGLLKFIGYCKEQAIGRNHAVLATITLPSEYLDPLAVLQTVNDPKQEHCYFEQVSRHQGVACAEPVLLFEGSGENRFADLKAYADEWFDHHVFVGETDLPWSGAHFFLESTFEDELDSIGFIPPVLAFIPRWQVGWKGNQFSATANTVVHPEDDIASLVESIWRAHSHFSSFEFEGEAEQESSDRIRAGDVEIINHQSSEKDYLQGVQSALSAISKGDLKKVVVARELLLRSKHEFQPLEILNVLRKRYPDCFTFSFQNNKGASIIGATPEKLIRVNQGVFSTEALAGSIKRGQSARQDAHLTKQLLGSSKDRNEHGLVLDFIEEELNALGLQVEFAKVPEILQLSNIQHLRVPLRGQLPVNIHILDLVKTLHPTPALGGYPTKAALKLISKIESGQREEYAGLTGWFNARGDGEMAVNIRCARVQGNEATLYAGAGIVEGSTPQSELQETALKLTSMLPIFINLDDL